MTTLLWCVLTLVLTFGLGLTLIAWVNSSPRARIETEKK